MKMQIESTTKIVEVQIGGQRVPARIWEGRTARGVPVHCYITRVAVHEGFDARELEAELVEHATPSAEVQALPARLVWP